MADEKDLIEIEIRNSLPALVMYFLTGGSKINTRNNPARKQKLVPGQNSARKLWPG
jgi:hypothetical protein